jgi:hypothetical protein
MSNDRESAVTFVTEVGVNDVVLGRGAPIAQMECNVRYRALCATHRGEYIGTGRNGIKHAVAKKVLAEINRRNGRFLRKVQTSAQAQELGVPNGVTAWVEISEDDALQKVKQTLREESNDSAETAGDVESNSAALQSSTEPTNHAAARVPSSTAGIRASNLLNRSSDQGDALMPRSVAVASKPAGSNAGQSFASVSNLLPQPTPQQLVLSPAATPLLHWTSHPQQMIMLSQLGASPSMVGHVHLNPTTFHPLGALYSPQSVGHSPYGTQLAVLGQLGAQSVLTPSWAPAYTGHLYFAPSLTSLGPAVAAATHPPALAFATSAGLVAPVAMMAATQPWVVGASPVAAAVAGAGAGQGAAGVQPSTAVPEMIQFPLPTSVSNSSRASTQLRDGLTRQDDRSHEALDGEERQPAAVRSNAASGITEVPLRSSDQSSTSEMDDERKPPASSTSETTAPSSTRSRNDSQGKRKGAP